MQMDSAAHRNVGVLDAAIRWLGAIAVLPATFLAISILDTDWMPTVLILGLMHAAYLALSAALRLDPFYLAVGWNTSRSARRHA